MRARKRLNTNRHRHAYCACFQNNAALSRSSTILLAYKALAGVLETRTRLAGANPGRCGASVAQQPAKTQLPQTAASAASGPIQLLSTRRILWFVESQSKRSLCDTHLLLGMKLPAAR